MNSKQNTTELITEESSKPVMPHQLVSDDLAQQRSAFDIANYNEHPFFEHNPRCIFRGSKREVGEKLYCDDFSDDFKAVRLTFGQRIHAVICEIFARCR